MDHELQAAQLFLDGYNCAQAITVAFSYVTGLDKHLSATLASSFGGGMGRMGEVCGAVSGMLMVAGVLYGYDADQDDDAKKAHYALVRELAGKFREEADSILCRDLLSNLSSDPNPAPRYAEFYKARPCARFVMLAARILDAYIAAHPVG